VDKINVKCKCGKGNLDQTLKDVSDIIMDKLKLDENKKDEDNQEEKKICPNHQKSANYYLNYYCIECFTHICKQCQSQPTNDHHCHRIFPCHKLKNIIKSNIKQNLILLFQNENFKDLCDNIAKEIQNEVETNFNNTLSMVDSAIKSLCEIREEYIKKYKEEIQRVIQTFKIIKIYYMNYYNDLEMVRENENVFKIKDINFLRYVNNISYEFEKLHLKHNDDLETKSKEIINSLKQYKQTGKKLIDYEFFFTETKRDYMIENIITNVHNKYITGLVELNNDRILTSCRLDYLMKIFQEDEEGNNYYLKNEKRGKCGCLLYLEKTNRIVSGEGERDISIYEETKPNNYEKTQSLSFHDGAVNCLAKLDENQFISGGADGKIVIWEEQNDQNKTFIAIDTIRNNTPITALLGCFDSRIAFSCDDKTIFIYKISEALEKKQQNIRTYIQDEVLKEQHKGKVVCLCQLKNGYIVSGGSEKIEADKKIPDHYIVVWRIENNKYIFSQKLKDHKSSITSIIQLRDGNFASSSYDRSVKIWRGKEEKLNENITYQKFELIYDLKQYDHGIHKLIQLKDDRLCATTSKNQLIFWRNRSGSY
jgi:WD40 repeat protein